MTGHNRQDTLFTCVQTVKPWPEFSRNWSPIDNGHSDSMLSALLLLCAGERGGHGGQHSPSSPLAPNTRYLRFFNHEIHEKARKFLVASQS